MMTANIHAVQAWWSGATADEMRVWRVAALRRAEKAEKTAIQLRCQSRVYLQESQQLRQQAYELETVARGLEIQGDMEGAGRQRLAASELQALSNANFKQAEQLGAQANRAQAEANQECDLAQKLAAALKNQRSPLAQ